MPDESYNDRRIWLPALYQEQWEPMVRLAVLLLGGLGVTRTCEQIVRDAMVEMYRRDPTFHSWPHVVGYLRAAVVNGVRAAVRHREDADPALNVAQADVNQDVVAMRQGPDAVEGESAVAIVTALRGLPRRQQEVLILRYYAEASEPEIAEALGITRGAVRSRAERGLTGLARALGEDSDDEQPAGGEEQQR